MTARELEEYLHEHIPLSKAMQVAVIEIQAEHVVLGAPLAPNINHRETVFGGSACAVAILAAWSLVHVRLHSRGIAGRLVIQRNSMSYDAAIFGAFTARSSVAEPSEWRRFVRTLERKGRGRISVSSALEHAGKVVGHLEGEFVALAAPDA